MVQLIIMKLVHEGQTLAVQKKGECRYMVCYCTDIIGTAHESHSTHIPALACLATKHLVADWSSA